MRAAKLTRIKLGPRWRFKYEVHVRPPIDPDRFLVIFDGLFVPVQHLSRTHGLYKLHIDSGRSDIWFELHGYKTEWQPNLIKVSLQQVFKDGGRDFRELTRESPPVYKDSIFNNIFGLISSVPSPAWL